MPATGALVGTPASISASEPPHTDAIDERAVRLEDVGRRRGSCTGSPRARHDVPRPSARRGSRGRPRGATGRAAAWPRPSRTAGSCRSTSRCARPCRSAARAAAAVPPGPGRQAADRRDRGRPHPSPRRRRAAGRPHPHERHRHADNLLPIAGHTAAAARCPAALDAIIQAAKAWGADLVIVETPGIGQGDAAIVPHVDVPIYVMTPEFGAASQLEKIDMLDFAEVVVINKFERRGAEDALRDVRRQFARNRERFDTDPAELPVFGTVASRFNDDGVTALYQHLRGVLAGHGLAGHDGRAGARRRRGRRRGIGVIVPPARAALPGRDRRDGADLPRAHRTQQASGRSSPAAAVGHRRAADSAGGRTPATSSPSNAGRRPSELEPTVRQAARSVAGAESP